jgi:mannose-6-phosphate isomerase-like protein (cupin superfamily)
MDGYVGQIEKITLENTYFRKVVFTAKHSQLVLMSIKPGEDVGMEKHDNVDQFFRFEQGVGKVVMNGEESEIKEGDAVLVPSGTNHNIVNTSETEALKFYTIYSPPNHKDGTIHKTKEEAIADEEDHYEG